MLVVFLLLERSSLRPNPASTQTTIMADTVAKAALGPRPGPYILKFWQGSVEIVLRGLVVVGGLASLIASAIALEALLSFPEDGVPTGSNRQIVDDFTERDLQFNSQAGAGTGIAVSVLLMFLGIVVIVMRFLNFGLVNAKSKIFWSIDIIVNFLLATGIGIAGILSAYMASLWAQVDNMYPDAAKLTRVTAAVAGTTLFTTLLLCFVMLWMMYYLIQKWNNKLVKETLKSVI